MNSSTFPDRAFRLMWAGEAVSFLGTATTATFLPILAVVEMGAGPGWMGALTAAAWLPWITVGLPAGAWVDLRDPRRVMIAADLFAAAALLSVPLAWALDALRLGHLLAVAFVVGTASVFFRAAFPRLLTCMVAAGDLTRASSRIYATESGSNVLGPGIAGSAAQTVSAALGLLGDAVTFLVSAACLVRLRGLVREQASLERTEPLIQRVRAGMRTVLQDRVLRYFAVLMAVQNFGLTGLATLQVLYLIEVLEASSLMTGLVLAIGGAGGVAGALAAPGLSRRFGSARASMGLQLLSCLCLLVPLAVPGLGLVLMALGLLAAGGPIVADNVIRSSWRLSYVPRPLLARVMTCSQIMGFGAMPLAAVVAGSLGSLIGIRAALFAMLAVHAVAALTMPFSPIGGMRDLPGPSSDEGSPELNRASLTRRQGDQPHRRAEAAPLPRS